MEAVEHDIYSEVERSHWWFQGRRAILSRVLNDLADLQGGTVVEFGCGTGYNLIAVFSDFIRKVGVDINDNALRHAKSLDIEVFAGDANCFNAVDQVDLVAFLDVLYHRKINIDDALENAYQILNKNGYILIFDGAFDFLAGQHNETVESARRFNKKNLGQLLLRHGFEIQYLNYWGVSLFCILFLKRVIIERFSSGADDNHDISFFLNGPMKILMKVENALTGNLSIPFGASIVAIGKRVVE